jgi:biopolymer transport protein ExbD
MSTRAAAILLCFASMAIGQSASVDPSTGVLTIRISADGTCYFLNTSTPCAHLGEYLLSRHLAPDGHVHVLVDKSSKYELVAATLESLDQAGFGKVGFVANEPSQ